MNLFSRNKYPTHTWLVPLLKATRGKCFLGLLMVLTLTQQQVSAQTSATINGVVRDGMNRPSPAATVTLENAATNLRRVTTTADDGTFAFEKIPEGQGYTIGVSSIGFKPKEL